MLGWILAGLLVVFCLACLVLASWAEREQRVLDEWKQRDL